MLVFNENIELVSIDKLKKSKTDLIWLNYILNKNNYIAAFFIVFEFPFCNDNISYHYFTCFIDKEKNVYEQNIFIDLDLSTDKITSKNFLKNIEKSNHLTKFQIDKIIKIYRLNNF